MGFTGSWRANARSRPLSYWSDAQVKREMVLITDEERIKLRYEVPKWQAQVNDRRWQKRRSYRRPVTGGRGPERLGLRGRLRT